MILILLKSQESQMYSQLLTLNIFSISCLESSIDFLTEDISNLLPLGICILMTCLFSSVIEY